MKIYTKTGDTGQTRLFGGEKLMKDSEWIEALGSIDEVNSLLGIVISFIENKDMKEKLLREQSNLLRLGADIATSLNAKQQLQKNIKRMNKEDVELLENEIDEFDKELDKLTKFILPGGLKASSFTHHARSVCRKAERSLVELLNNEKINLYTIKYLNRLSDWLFTLARYLNKKEGVSDTLNPN